MAPWTGCVLCTPLRAQDIVRNEEDKEKSLTSRLVIDKGSCETRNSQPGREWYQCLGEQGPWNEEHDPSQRFMRDQIAQAHGIQEGLPL